MSDFIDFVSNNINNSTLGKSFIDTIKPLDAKTDADILALQKWFKDQGYDLSLHECSELILKKDNFLNYQNATVKY